MAFDYIDNIMPMSHLGDLKSIKDNTLDKVILIRIRIPNPIRRYKKKGIAEFNQHLVFYQRKFYFSSLNLKKQLISMVKAVCGTRQIKGARKEDSKKKWPYITKKSSGGAEPPSLTTHLVFINLGGTDEQGLSRHETFVSNQRYRMQILSKCVPWLLNNIVDRNILRAWDSPLFIIVESCCLRIMIYF